MQRRHHYEHAFEAYLRARRIPYVAVDEARKALLPAGALGPISDGAGSLKSFDLVIYGEGANLLVEVKGRRIVPRRGRVLGARDPSSPAVSTPSAGRLECWVTQDDVESLARWETLFGPAFEAAFVFVYWCDELPPDALFEEIFVDGSRWYAIKCVRLRDYRGAMRTRSPKWRTVDLSPSAFARLAGPLATPEPGRGTRGPHVGITAGSFAHAELPPLPAFDRLAGPG
ncbi:MAG: hypothetical protein HBSAPP03_24270 [Phycisphaerae bacterium]|nr:MAG: hypothetical protein HBSAPP03_24270 [Phycisphaerae bacterium]